MNLFNRKSKGDAAVAEPEHRDSCLHTVLLPRWDSAGDIGNESRATGYLCEACSGTFTPAEAHLLRDTEAERLGARAGAY